MNSLPARYLALTALLLGASSASDLPRYDRVLLLETTAETSANASFGDVDGDGHLDIVLAKGRHWPLVNRVLQVTPTRAAQRHTSPGQPVLVRETAAGNLILVAVDVRTGAEHTLSWTPIEPGAAQQALPLPMIVDAPPVSRPEAPPAGYTRSGKPLSAKQMAVRERWSRQVDATIALGRARQLDITDR